MSWSDPFVRHMAARFKALGEPGRLRIIELLRTRGDQTVSQLGDASGLSQANLSRHLQILHAAGLVRRQREGPFVRYGLADQEIAQLCDIMCGRLEQELERDRQAVREV